MSTIITTPATVVRAVRVAAVVGLVGALLQVLSGIVETVDRVRPAEPGFAFRASLIGIAYLTLIATVIGLARSGIAGDGRPALVGLGAAGLGWVLSAVAQFVLQVEVEVAEKILFPAATIVIGLGMVTAGIAVLRARRWRGWRRLTPIICGLYPFLVMFPVFASTGAPNFLVLSGWGACWLALGAALWIDS